jgi:cytochrome c peroxidase
MKYLSGNVLALALAGLGCAAYASQDASAPARPAAAAAPAQPRQAAQPAPAAETFDQLVARLKAAKPEFARGHQALLESRYDLADRPAQGVTMARGKTVQAGVRVKLPAGESWDSLAAKTPEEIKSKDLFPLGFLPLPHPNHALGGMVFPKNTIDDLKKQTKRDLERFDVDHDLPEHFL